MLKLSHPQKLINSRSLRKKNHNVAVSVGLKSWHMRLASCAFDTDAGPNIIKDDLAEPKLGSAYSPTEISGPLQSKYFPTQDKQNNFASPKIRRSTDTSRVWSC